MARGIENYPNITPSDSDYPNGRIKDNDGSGNATPINEVTNGDLQQYFDKLLRESGIIANGLPENETNGHQYMEALKALIQSKVREDTQWFELTLKTGVTGKILYKKKADQSVVIVSENLNANSSLVNGLVDSLGILPEGFRPFKNSELIPITAIYGGVLYRYDLQILSSGSVEIVSTLTTEPGPNMADGNIQIPFIRFETT